MQHLVEELENMLTQNKITFAKAERFISKRMRFCHEITAMAEALIAKKLSLSKIWHDFQGRGL